MRIIFVTHDLGGGNVLRSVAERFKRRRHACLCIGFGPSINAWRHSGPRLITPTQRKVSWKLRRYVQAFRPNVVVTGTSVRADQEHLAWKAARIAGVPSMALIDGWVKVPDRFPKKASRIAKPTRYGVIDSKIKRMLVRQCRVSPTDVDIIGHPHLEKISTEISLRRSQRERTSMLTLAFFSTPINDSEAAPGLDAIDALIPHLARHAPLTLLIKPHPREQHAPWQHWLDQFRAQQVDGDIDISLAVDEPTSNILCAVDAVIGLPTSVMMEAAFSGIPVMVLEPDWWPISNIAIRSYLANSIAKEESIREQLSSLIERIGSPATISRDGSVKSAAQRTAKAIRRLAHRSRRFRLAPAGVNVDCAPAF